MQSVEILIGTIASGKSTYCHQKALKRFIIINDDAIVNALHCNYYDLYEEKLKPLYKSIENQIFTSSISAGKSVVVDRGLNLTPKSRRRFIGLANSLDVEVNAIVFEFCDPEVHAKRRMESDSRGFDYDYWLDVAKFQCDKYLAPTLSEGFSEIQYV